MSAKWSKAVKAQEYDSFMDYNLGFWVKSLDDYITHWQSSDPKLEMIGIEWQLPEELTVDITDPSYINNQWYSVLVHSPDSGANFEFMSYSKPTQYDSIRTWLTEKFPRCTFQQMTDPYPWGREDGTPIVPVRVSHATSNREKLKDFHTHILQGQILYQQTTSNSMGPIKMFASDLQESTIEVMFVQRPDESTLGDFTVELYEDLLMETHDSIITSPYCGQDRWMDNHFALSVVQFCEFANVFVKELGKNFLARNLGKSSKMVEML